MAKMSTKKKGGSACKGGCWAAGKRGSRKTRGGATVGVGEPITAGALEYKAAYTGPVNSAGNAVPDPTDPAGGYTGIGGRRRRKTSKKSRKSRKGSKKTRKHRMRGGAESISAMKAGYGFNGSGAGGLADAVQAPTSGGNAF